MIKIITDSGCDIPQDEAKMLGIKVIPIITSFQGEEFLDGVTLTHEEFYKRLAESDTLPKTTQVNPSIYDQAFKEEIDQGNEVLCITLGSKLSGCFQSANIAKASYMDKVRIIDSNNVCIAQRNLVMLALDLIKQGKSISDIESILNKEKENICILASLDTLEYLQKGGRISKTVAFIGSILAVKPVVSVKEGEVKLIGKARGYKNVHNLLMQFVEKTGGINFSKPLALAYSGTSKDMLEKYIQNSKALYKDYQNELSIYQIGCAIGTHVGPGAVCVSYFKKKEN